MLMTVLGGVLIAAMGLVGAVFALFLILVMILLAASPYIAAGVAIVAAWKYL